MCENQPLLAYYGVDEYGRLYVHQKVYKGGRVFGESLFYGGTVLLMCRNCFRWHKIIIQERTTPEMSRTRQPRVVREESETRRSLPERPSLS